MLKIMLDEFSKLECEFHSNLESVFGVRDLEELRVKFLSRKGLLISTLRSIKDLPEDERIVLGLEANRLRRDFMEIIAKHASREV